MRIDERVSGDRLKDIFLLGEYTVWKIFDISKFTKFDKSKIKRVLLVHHGAIGELVVLSSIARTLKKELNCSITIMLKRGMEKIFENNPNVDNFIFYEGSLKDKIAMIKKGNFDLALVNQASFYNSLMCYKGNVKFRVGAFSRIKRFPVWLYNRRVYPIGLKHSIERNMDMLKLIGINERNPKTEIYIKNSEIKSMQGKLKKMNVSKFAIIHPGFGPKGQKSPPRELPKEEYAQVADFLIDKYKFDVILTGSIDQSSDVNSITSLMRNKKKVHNLAGKTNLRELFSLVKLARIVIAPDTGVSHVSAALGTPLVNLMDAPIEEWGPVGDKNKIENIRNAREIVLFEDWKIIHKKGGVKSIQAIQIEKAIDKLLS